MTGALFWAVLAWLSFLLFCAVIVVAGWIKPHEGGRPWLIVLVCPVLLTWMALARWAA